MVEQVQVASGVVHEVPEDLKMVLLSHSDLLIQWNGLTPLGRNEWICWMTSVKKIETRKAHLERLVQDIQAGKRRPCCWPGCGHRNANAKKWFK